MAYRGEDLDLRTPQTWSSEGHGGQDAFGNGTRGRSGAYQRSPIFVDDVVLGCCNHAFDVASAHRAMDVRIEHLLHAMTRVDAATGALEARGFRVAGLRRESATIIASEIPIGLGSGQTRPRRSDDLETVLRSASTIAGRRGGPANVDDVIDALLEMPNDIPGIGLLARHGGRSARDRQTFREALPLPPLSRTGAATDLGDWGRKSYAAESSRILRAEIRGGESRGAEWSRDHGREVATTDSVQNARIEQLESAVRALTAELSNERTGVTTLVQDLQRNLVSDRDDTIGRLVDRIASLEQVLASQVSDLSRPWAILSERLQSLEQALVDTRHARAIDLTPVQDRLAGIERTVRDTVADRLNGIERGVELLSSKPSDFDTIASRLDIIEEAVLSDDGSKVGNALVERFRELEQSLTAQRAALQHSTSGLATDVKSLASALTAQSGSVDRVQSQVAERLQVLSAGFERQRGDILAGINERFGGLATAIDGRLQQVARPLSEQVNALDGRIQAALAPTLDRLGKLEALLATSIERTMELQTQHTTELKEVHEALLKLNTNQHTLAGSIDQWRLDGVGDVSVIANRLEVIERNSAQPAELLAQLTTNVDNIGRATVERYHRRNRFWYWLFGTDDWLGASWPSQVAAVEAERQNLRGMPQRTTPSVRR